jgi:hypothetical protein
MKTFDLTKVESYANQKAIRILQPNKLYYDKAASTLVCPVKLPHGK